MINGYLFPVKDQLLTSRRILVSEKSQLWMSSVKHFLCWMRSTINVEFQRYNFSLTPKNKDDEGKIWAGEMYLVDVCCLTRVILQPSPLESSFPRVEAVVLFGEPIRWETSLQLLIDVIMTNGLPTEAPKCVPRPHLPILACNMDLQWMAEACMPRYLTIFHCRPTLFIARITTS